MTERLPSLDRLLDLVQAERNKQLAHFDGLDSKAGIVLVFSGVLITLAPGVGTVFRLIGIGSAVIAAALALAAFWPRRYPILEPSPLRNYLRADEAFTRLTVLDTFVDFVNEGSQILQRKGRRLRFALWALTAAIISIAGGNVWSAT